MRWIHSIKQECIPVGCVLSAAVAVGGMSRGWVCVWKVGVSRGVCVCTGGGVFVQLGVCPGGLYTFPPVDRMTDTCENIIFPQLVLQTVIRNISHILLQIIQLFQN